MGKPFSTLATLGLLKILLILFNTLFWASGLVMLIIGVWMILQLHKYVETPDNSRVSTALPLTFMGLAASIMVLASLACCCTAKGKVPLLYLYSFLLMAILLVESTILSYGYYFREQITAGFHSAMSNGLQQYGREPSLSSVVDDIQSTLWCCGLTNYTDWQGTPWGRGHPDKLPYSCCQFTFKGVCAANDESAFMHTTGCYRLVMNFILDNATKIGVAVLSAAVIHITGVVLTCLLARSISKANYEEIS